MLKNHTMKKSLWYLINFTTKIYVNYAISHTENLLRMIPLIHHIYYCVFWYLLLTLVIKIKMFYNEKIFCAIIIKTLKRKIMEFLLRSWTLTHSFSLSLYWVLLYQKQIFAKSNTNSRNIQFLQCWWNIFRCILGYMIYVLYLYVLLF